MRLKEVFRFPETLLPLSVLLGPLIVGKTTIDIQLHDTYYIFGGYRWGNAFLAPFFSIMVQTWVLHIILRRKGLLSNRRRWVQVLTTVISWLAILVILAIPAGNFISPAGIYLYSNFGWVGSTIGAAIYSAPWLLFVFGQLNFWIVATIRLISGRGARASE
jgi:hypothetical protein